MDFERMKKQIIRDSLIVIPTLLFVVAWIFVELNPNIDLAPGANYGNSVLVNLLIPLAILGIAQIIYALVLMIVSFQEKMNQAQELLIYMKYVVKQKNQ